MPASGSMHIGCIPGARHTLNKQIHNVINATKNIDVFPLCQVNRIEETSDINSSYKYKIFFRDYRDSKDGIDRVIRTKQAILAAGCLGSSEILLRSKNLQLSNTLGTHFSTNGDLLGIINPTKENVDASRGPITTSIVRFKNNDNGNFAFSIEDQEECLQKCLPPYLIRWYCRKEPIHLYPKHPHEKSCNTTSCKGDWRSWNVFNHFAACSFPIMLFFGLLCAHVLLVLESSLLLTMPGAPHPKVLIVCSYSYSHMSSIKLLWKIVSVESDKPGRSR